MQERRIIGYNVAVCTGNLCGLPGTNGKIAICMEMMFVLGHLSNNVDV